MASAAKNAAKQPPNVVMIVSDDQAWTDFGFMGHEVIKTPHLDRLATGSAVFPNGYVPTSLCRGSLATILTGLYGHQHKICCNDPPRGIDRSVMLPFMRDAPTIPRLLQKRGYRSFQTGKFWEGHYTNGGFTDGMTVKGRHGDDGLVIGRQTMQPMYDFIEKDRSKPFFLWYAPMLPHEPHDPPERLLAKYRAPGRPEALARYWANVERFDETCGELLAYLDRNALRENTLVMFVVDNGWIQETNPRPRRFRRGNFADKSKLSPYDGGLRTPVMLRWPGHTKPGRYEDLVSTVDFAPTVLKACGMRTPSAMPGVSLLGRASGGPALKRDTVFGELYVHTAIDVERPSLNLTHRWVRSGDWKLIRPVDPSVKPELYDLKADPFENRSLATAEPERVRALTAKLEKWWDGFRDETPFKPIADRQHDRSPRRPTSHRPAWSRSFAGRGFTSDSRSTESTLAPSSLADRALPPCWPSSEATTRAELLRKFPGEKPMPHFDKYFTVDEANALLPELRGLILELKAVRSHLEVSHENAKPILKAAKTNGGGKEGGGYLNDVQALYRRLERFNDLGIQLKDIDRGLVDFPAWREDREILLCWHLDEDSVEFWHELETGFAGRKRL